MTLKKRTNPLKDEIIVIYYSNEDESWIAHSLRTDQMGFGDCVVDALVDLMIGTHNLLKLAKKEKLQILFKAPKEIQELVKNARTLNDCIMQIAYEKFLKKIPPEYELHLDIPHSEHLKYEGCIK